MKMCSSCDEVMLFSLKLRIYHNAGFRTDIAGGCDKVFMEKQNSFAFEFYSFKFSKINLKAYMMCHSEPNPF